MALWQPTSPLRRLFGPRPNGRDHRYHRLQERHDSLSRAIDEWLTLLRDMEQNGESSGSQYDRYFQAYLQAKQQRKDVDLQLFNHRRELLG